MNIYQATHIGHREENQDQLIVLRSQGTEKDVLVVVADGMGGHKGGKLAAEAVISSACDLWQERKRNIEPRAFLSELVTRSHEAVIKLNSEELEAPQSTMCALLLTSSTISSVHVGDSRVMQYANGKFVKRTTDHSMAQLLALEGKISEQEMATHAMQNKLFRSVGGEAEPQIEFVEWERITSQFVICSDGFWELFSQLKMGAAIGTIDSDQSLLTLIETEIKKHAKHDNTTVVIVDYIHSDSSLRDSITQTGVGKAIISNSASQTASMESALQKSAHKKSGIPTSEAKPLFVKVKVLYFLLLLVATSIITTAIFLFVASDRDERSAEPIPSTTDQYPSPIPTSRKSVNIEVENQQEAIERSGSILQQDELLSRDDVLIELEQVGSLGETQVIRTQQYYKGIPVYGAQVVIFVQNGSVTKIDSKTYADIKLNSEPSLNADQALAKAKSNLDIGVIHSSKGQLVIYKKDTYRLAWEYQIETSNGNLETLIIDANNAEVLLRLSKNIHTPTSVIEND